MFSRIFPPRADMATDYHQSRLPAWILLPVIAASGISVLIGWATGSLFLGFVTVLVGAAAVAWWCEEMLRAVAGTMGQIASGDRYAALPGRIGSGALGDSAIAAERPGFLHPAVSRHG
jgi:hypothetical protein